MRRIAPKALAVGLGLGSALKAGSALSVDSLTIVFFIALGASANLAQMVLFHFLDKIWRTKNLSMSMMPTLFFMFNLLAILGFVATRDLNQLYPFVSSLGFLPALALVGAGTSNLAQRISSGPNLGENTIREKGLRFVRQNWLCGLPRANLGHSGRRYKDQWRRIYDPNRDRKQDFSSFR